MFCFTAELILGIFLFPCLLFLEKFGHEFISLFCTKFMISETNFMFNRQKMTSTKKVTFLALV